MKIKDNYWNNTPKFWRKLGDALLATSATVTTFAIYEEAKWVAIVALMTGTIGTFLTNLFTVRDK